VTPPFSDRNIRIGVQKFKMNGEQMYDIKIMSYSFEKGAWFIR
jgi:hypothetical protein